MPLPIPSRSRISNLRPPTGEESSKHVTVLRAMSPYRSSCQTSCNACRAYSPCEGTDHTNLVHEILHELFAIFVFQSFCDPISLLCRLDFLRPRAHCRIYS